MSTNDSLSSPPVSLPKLKAKLDIQDYVSFVGQLPKLDAHLVLPELSNNASIHSFEDEATYRANLASGAYFSTELVRADPLPVTANVDGVELDDWTQILDSRAGPFGTDITATNSRFRTNAGEDATFMDAGVTDLFQH